MANGSRIVCLARDSILIPEFNQPSIPEESLKLHQSKYENTIKDDKSSANNPNFDSFFNFFIVIFHYYMIK